MLGAAVAGCGGDTPAGSDAHGCDGRSGTARTAECVDYENVPAANLAGLAQNCESVSGGHWLGGACDHSGAVGGCRTQVGNGAPAGVTEVQWWWPGAAGGLVTDAASAQRACATIKGSMFVTP